MLSVDPCTPVPLRIHVWYIYLDEWLIYMVNVGKHTIYGSDGFWIYIGPCHHRSMKTSNIHLNIKSTKIRYFFQPSNFLSEFSIPGNFPEKGVKPQSQCSIVTLKGKYEEKHPKSCCTWNLWHTFPSLTSTFQSHISSRNSDFLENIQKPGG